MKASALFIIVSLLLSMVYAPSSFYVNADLTDNDEDHDDVFGLRSAPKKEKNACWKDAVGRGVGTKPDKRECPVGKELSLGLCYPKCKGEYTGVGPVCWEVCPTKYPTNGLVFCCVDEETCETYLKDLGIALPTALAKAIEDAVNGRFGKKIEKIIEDLKELVKDALEVDFPKCNSLPSEVEGENELIVADE